MIEFSYETFPDKQSTFAALFYVLMKVHEKHETKQ